MSRSKNVMALGTLTMVLFFFQNCGQFSPEEFSGSGVVDAEFIPGTSINTAELLGASIMQAPAVNNDYQCSSASSIALTQNARRLTQNQFKLTFRQLLRGVTTAERTALETAIYDGVTFPSDSSDRFDRFDNSISNNHARAFFYSASNFSRYLTANTGIMVKIVKAFSPTACSAATATSISQACRDSFIEEFGLRSYRRPLLDAEKTAITQAYASGSNTAQKVAMAIFRMLVAPQFLFQIENQGELVQSGVVRLTPYELASKISYHFTNRAPDDELLESARTEDLLTTAGYRTQVERIFSQTATRNSLDYFFERWLKVDNIPAVEDSTLPEIRYLAPNVTFNSDLQQAIKDEMTDLTDYITFIDKGSFSDLFTSNVHVTRNTNLMRLYGVTQAAPSPLVANSTVRLPANERAGILTRIGYLSSGASTESTVARGVHALNDMLCVFPPPADTTDLPEDAFLPPAHNANLTTREKWTQKTSVPTCIGCHQTINPPGYALNGYNGLGQFRTDQAMFDLQGNFVKNLRVTTDADMSLSLGAGIRVNNAIELSEEIAKSIKAQKCFSKKYAEFALNRLVDETKDSCALSTIRKSMGRNGELPLEGTFKAIVYDKSFFYRKL